MHGRRKSDSPIVPGKLPNKAGKPAAEAVEERGLAKGNSNGQNARRTQRRASVHSALDRVRAVAKRDKEAKLTALMHHVYDVERLRAAYEAQRPRAAAGVDGVTWDQYGEALEENLEGLAARLKRGAYRAKPVRRAYIEKADGRQRPLGIPALEDKIVQRAAVEVLNAIYESDFLGFSYGFRPKRSQHQALNALAAGIQQRKVSWVLDADIRGFFDTLDHGWLVKFLEHRIADKRIVRLIQKWLNAGVLEEGKRIEVTEGTPQGGSISPLLANVYLHYAFDQWVHRWRRTQARGEVIVVRYADDFVVGFQHRDDAIRFRLALAQRLARFGLALHPDKTRLIQFGRFADQRAAKEQGKRKPETFDFLGFTHICGRTREGWFIVLRKTMSKRQRRKLAEVKSELRRRMHAPVPVQGAYLRAVVNGHLNYYGVPGNHRMLWAFRTTVIRHWQRALSRRSHKAAVKWARMLRLVTRWIPPIRIVHPTPRQALAGMTRGRSPVR